MLSQISISSVILFLKVTGVVLGIIISDIVLIPCVNLSKCLRDSNPPLRPPSPPNQSANFSSGTTFCCACQYTKQPVYVHCSARRAVSKIGGNGEIRTHGPLSEPTVFKTVAINRALPHFLDWSIGLDLNQRINGFAIRAIRPLWYRCIDIGG